MLCNSRAAMLHPGVSGHSAEVIGHVAEYLSDVVPGCPRHNTSPVPSAAVYLGAAALQIPWLEVLKLGNHFGPPRARPRRRNRAPTPFRMPICTCPRSRLQMVRNAP